MFYSHELLHNKEYGVATIWLVATLGSKSNLKKVTRKAILDVDIPKACATITDPEAPLALRLQASLLYGVSRVHSQQCNYVLTDTQSFRDKMRSVAQRMKDLELDPETGRTRPEQLNLAEDSAFIPELDLMFDLSAFDLPSDTASSRASSLLSPFSGLSSQTSRNLDEEEEVALELPPLDTPDDFGGFQFPAESSVAAPSPTKSAQYLLQHEESAIIADPDFEITEDGSLVAPASVRARQTPSVAPASETGFSARVRAEHEAGWQAQQNALHADMDDGLVLMDEDDSRLPPAEPFPPAIRNDINPSSDAPAPISPLHEQPAAAATSVSNDSAAAPQRKTRGPRLAQPDLRTELQNADLGAWSTNYLNNMADLARTKQQNRSTFQAKKNAAFWILGQGIGGVQANFGGDREPHPLAMFSGQELLDALMGPRVAVPESPGGGSASKRARSSSPLGEEERRVRARTEDAQAEMGRGTGDDAVVLGFDDEGVNVLDDDFNPESEVGRHHPSSLPDVVASILPWNRSGTDSRFGSAQPGVSSSIGGIGGMNLPGGSSSVIRGRQGSIMRGIMRGRLSSASPLVGKGKGRRRGQLPSMDLDDLMDLAAEQRAGATEENDDGLVLMDVDDEPRVSRSAEDIDEEFELYGPAAGVDTQTAASSQWMRQVLEEEALNFLGFVENMLAGGGRVGGNVSGAIGCEEGGDGEGEEEVEAKAKEEITMDGLLPPARNSAVVGAQALLHVLSLVSKGLMGVRQEVGFGEIVVWVEGGRGAQGRDRGVVDADAEAEADEADEEDNNNGGGGVEDEEDSEGEGGEEEFEEAVEHQEEAEDVEDDEEEEDDEL